MRITDAIIQPLLLSQTYRDAVSITYNSSRLLDRLNISESAQQKIGQLQQGNSALEQAVTKSRQAVRSAAHERVGYAKEYLKILVRMSLPGDRAAALEAARMAREIKAAAAEFGNSIACSEENGDSIRSEIAGFAEVAGDALKLAQRLVASYLSRRKTGHGSDNALEKDVNNAASAVSEMVNKTAATA